MKFPKPISLKEIAQIIDVKIIGDEGYLATGVNEIHTVETGDLTFVDHPKYYSKALNSAATVIIINSEDVEYPEGKHLLVCKDPFKEFVALGQHFTPFQPLNKFVSDSAEIGEGSVIQYGASVGNDVRIGKNCLIHSGVMIYDGVVIGDNVIIHSNSVLGADAYYFQKKDGRYRKMKSCGNVIIENDVEIGALCAIDKGVTNDTVIGEGTKLDNQVQIGHDTVVGKHCLLGAKCSVAGVTVIEDDCLIWAEVAINKDLVIGKGTVILATSKVDKSLDGGKTYFGAPAKEFRQAWKEMAYVKEIPNIINTLKANDLI